MSAEDGRFNMEGGSCTNNISWVRGHDPVPPPMDEASSLYRERILAKAVPADGPCYRDPVPAAHRRDQLPPLQRRGQLDRLRRRTGPARHRYRDLRPVTAKEPPDG
jgi:hypothetical protein